MPDLFGGHPRYRRPTVLALPGRRRRSGLLLEVLFELEACATRTPVGGSAHGGTDSLEAQKRFAERASSTNVGFEFLSL